MREGYHCHSLDHRGGTMAGALMLLLPFLFPSLFTPFSHALPSVLSEWNAPKPRHSRLLRGALEREISSEQQAELWRPLPNQGWKPCLHHDSTPTLPEKSEGYIQVFLDGGLNQQRMGICDAVALAKILNATLIIPHLEVNPVWKDSSTFEDIFDVDHFINVLKDDISIFKDLPEEYFWSTREYYATAIRANRIKTAPVHASANWYLENVSPVLQSYGIAAIAPFSHRLAFDNMPDDIQRLRCKVNFQALVFVPSIRDLGNALVHRLRYPPTNVEGDSSNFLQKVTDTKYKQGNGKFVVLHLRFDKDMAAHSACDFGGGKAENLALAKYRQVIYAAVAVELNLLHLLVLINLVEVAVMELSIQCLKIPLTSTPLLSSAVIPKLPTFAAAIPSYALSSSITLKSPPSALRHSQFIRACSRVDAAGTDPQVNKILQFRDAFWRFLRPHTIRGTTLGSFSLVTRALIENPELIRWSLLLKAVSGLIALICGNGFIVGINQIYDVGIDKVNKPYLPIAAGDLSERSAWILVLLLAAAGLVIVGMNFGPFITSLYCFGLFLGTIYSVPPLRMKRFPVVAFLIIATVRGFLLNYGVYYATRAALGLPFEWSYPVAFITSFVTLFALVIAITKDLPDVEGDRKFQIDTLATKLGVRNIALLGSGLLLINYIGSVVAAIYLPQAFKRSLMIPSHVILVLCLVFQAWVLEKANYTKEAISDFYRFIWNLFYTEYALFPFI